MSDAFRPGDLIIVPEGCNAWSWPGKTGRLTSWLSSERAYVIVSVVDTCVTRGAEVLVIGHTGLLGWAPIHRIRRLT